jgi:hypothetical protein
MSSLLSRLRAWLCSRYRSDRGPFDQRRLLQAEELEQREVLSGTSFLLDFGKDTSPVAPGYTQVPLVAYSQALGYGWNDLTSMYTGDWGGADPLTRDFHYGLNKAGADKTFMVDVPNGTYDVTVLLGGRSPQDRIDLYAEGQKVGSQLSVGFEQTLPLTYRVAVADGQLNLRFVDTGGASTYFAVGGLEIVPVAPPALPALSINDVSVSEGNDGTTSAVFTVTLSQASSQTVTVNYATADGSAMTADNDYVGKSGTLTFAPGQTSQTVSVTVNGDYKAEPDEDFFVNLSGAVNASVADGQGRGVILDDGDAAYVVIDSAWLAAHGAGPYVLDQAGKTYVLMTDVRTAGTAFVVGAAGVTLDLHGHTVTGLLSP